MLSFTYQIQLLAKENFHLKTSCLCIYLSILSNSSNDWNIIIIIIRYFYQEKSKMQIIFLIFAICNFSSAN